MDPRGGINPSNPRLDGMAPRPAPQRPDQPSFNQQPQQAVPQATVQQQPVMSEFANPAVPQVTAPTIENPVPSQVNAYSQDYAVSPVQESFVDQPIATQPKSSQGTLKKVLLLVGVLVLLGGVGGGAYYAGLSAGTAKGKRLADAEYQKTQAAAQAAEDETEAPDESSPQELSLGTLIDPKYVDETKEGEVGAQLDSSDGFVIKVANIERNFKSTDPNYKLDTSKELIKINFLIGNKDKSKAKDISSFNFRLENSSGAQLTPENVAGYEGKFDTVKLDPGGQAKGSIVYAVNKDEKPLKFIREQRYRISSENREVTTRTVITVAK